MRPPETATSADTSVTPTTCTRDYGYIDRYIFEEKKEPLVLEDFEDGYEPVPRTKRTIKRSIMKSISPACRSPPGLFYLGKIFLP